jgi:hypothetical protein
MNDYLHPGDIPAPQYKCPHCDYRWWRDRVGRPIPLCPEHKIQVEKENINV